jgi:hypothetical protein
MRPLTSVGVFKDMQGILITTAACGLVVLVGCNNGVAGNEEEANKLPDVIPMVETYACNYKDGHGTSDLNEVVANWNAWMDGSEGEPYSAWTWTPFYFGSDETYDFVWLGITPDAATLERSHDSWLAKGGEIQAHFNKIASCDTHYNFAATNFIQPPEREDPSSAIVTFTGCDIAEDKTFGDVSPVLDIWAEYVTDIGSVRGMWILRRAYGSGDDENDFKWINSFPNHAALGADYDRMRRGGSDKARELFGGVFKCGITRVYNAETRRIGIDDELYRLN